MTSPNLRMLILYAFSGYRWIEHLLRDQRKRRTIDPRTWGWRFKHYWFNQLSELSKKLQVVAIDLPGHGKSERFKGKPTIERYAEHVVNFVNQMRLGKVVMLGHSMGGLVVQQMAFKHPEMLDKLIIVDSSTSLLLSMITQISCKAELISILLSSRLCFSLRRPWKKRISFHCWSR